MYDFSFLQHLRYIPIDVPLTQEEVLFFEQVNGITIPDDYKYFLMNVGNGIKIKIDEKTVRYIYGIKRPISRRYNRRLKINFSFEDPYHERQNTHNFELPIDCIDPEDEDEDSCLNCPNLDTCFYAFSDSLDEYDHMLYNGAYPICYAGCTYVYFLIFTGKHRGKVWINNETYDFAPSKESFGEFLHWVTKTDSI